MTGPLTPEREAEYREWLERARPRYFATRARRILAALDDERAEHDLTRTALIASTEYMIEAALSLRQGGYKVSARALDEQVQANQTALGLSNPGAGGHTADEDTG